MSLWAVLASTQAKRSCMPSFSVRIISPEEVSCHSLSHIPRASLPSLLRLTSLLLHTAAPYTHTHTGWRGSQPALSQRSPPKAVGKHGYLHHTVELLLTIIVNPDFRREYLLPWISSSEFSSTTMKKKTGILPGSLVDFRKIIAHVAIVMDKLWSAIYFSKQSFVTMLP